MDFVGFLGFSTCANISQHQSLVNRTGRQKYVLSYFLVLKLLEDSLKKNIISGKDFLRKSCSKKLKFPSHYMIIVITSCFKWGLVFLIIKALESFVFKANYERTSYKNLKYLYWFVIVHNFQPIILIYLKGNFIYHHWGYAQIIVHCLIP